MLIKASNGASEGDRRQGRNSAGNESERLLMPFQAQKRDLASATTRRPEVISKIICTGVAFASIGKTVVGKSNNGKTDVGRSKGNKY